MNARRTERQRREREVERLMARVSDLMVPGLWEDGCRRTARYILRRERALLRKHGEAGGRETARTRLRAQGRAR
jgi:hypothetical protein